jgi:hypothetical protein
VIRNISEEEEFVLEPKCTAQSRVQRRPQRSPLGIIEDSILMDEPHSPARCADPPPLRNEALVQIRLHPDQQRVILRPVQKRLHPLEPRKLLEVRPPSALPEYRRPLLRRIRR